MATTAETVTAARARLEAARGAQRQADREVYAAELAVEEAEGRSESFEAQFARAVLTDDYPTMKRLSIACTASWRTKYPGDHAAREAEIARAMQAEG